MKNKVQLIAYADRFGGSTLADLHALLTGPLTGVFGGVHVLPFFLPIDGADAGFDPIDHMAVDPRLGKWDDVSALARDFDVMGDVIVNHMSTQSPQFQDYNSHGDASRYRDLFLKAEDVFPEGPQPADLAAIYRPRPGPPFTDLRLSSGRHHQFWTTFTPQQVDINVETAEGAAYLGEILARFRASGIAAIRLDAVGYAIKRAGTSCFLIPETITFLTALIANARHMGFEVLVEIHAHYLRQIEIARLADRVYDFALPPLLLHAFAFKRAKYLHEWIAIRPENAVTVLDTHDGIGIIDIGADADHSGLVPPSDLRELVEIIHQRSRDESRLATGAAADNVDLYQVNCTFFDAMGRDEEQYLLARAAQLFLPGIPQVYYVGLLAGHNDMALLARTGVGRDINRHYYGRAEVEQELGRPVVRRLIELIRLRNDHPAFGGRFECHEAAGEQLVLKWTYRADWAELTVGFAEGRGELRFTQDGEIARIAFGDARVQCHAATI